MAEPAWLAPQLPLSRAALGRLYDECYADGYRAAVTELASDEPLRDQVRAIARRAVARHGSMAAAARALKVDRSTMYDYLGPGERQIRAARRLNAGEPRRPERQGRGEHGKRPKSQVQSVAFPRASWTPEQARAWLAGHGFKAGKLDETANFLRFRQLPPGRFTSYGTKVVQGTNAALGRKVPVHLVIGGHRGGAAEGAAERAAGPWNGADMTRAQRKAANRARWAAGERW